MKLTLSAPVVELVFPADTLDTPFTFAITGTTADGQPFTAGSESPGPSEEFDLPSGTFTLVVSKNGISSLESDPFTVDVPTTVTLSVPDATQKASIAAA